jgi:iron(III) transport system ATP-binding protein
MVAIVIDKLGVAYGGNRVIDDLSLTIDYGSFFTLLGPSGCGKTTLLRALAGFAPTSGGRILFGDRDVSHMPAHARDIGMVFQDYALFPDKTVYDNVAYGLRARKIDEASIKARVGEQLERVGLAAFPMRRPAELSGGQRQRVALARALVIRPTLLLMDEPLSNLDAKLRVQVRETIADLQREAGITTVFVTHDQEEALALSDKIGLMKKGKLEQVGTAQEIYRMPVSTYVADFVGGANVLPTELTKALGAGQGASLPVSGGKVSATAHHPVPVGKAFVVARPEDIGLSTGGKAQGLRATIRSRQFLGGATHYRAALADGASLGIVLHGADHDAHAAGDSVAVSFDPARTLVVAE